MNTADLFTAFCRALWGERFKAPAAEALKVSIARIDDWSKGRGRPPAAGVWHDLAAIASNRQAELSHLLPLVRRATERSTSPS
ncbi:hypothetical protein [Nitrobacter sp.]|uniref:hypothetical protein n=1 Tax=Nitrobacter sp. TaxID=29420 RepID=UPI0029CAABC2|nr:hypothetical protein [Nitrobacter sp.]